MAPLEQDFHPIVARRVAEGRDEDTIVLVIDSGRTVVYSRGCGAECVEEIRDETTLGEVFGCEHAEQHPGGCGSADACLFCGANEAVRKCRETGDPVERECTIRTRRDGYLRGLNYRVSATPFSLRGIRYILLEFEDTGAEKRRRALERVFYHDILNTATGLQVYLDLLRQEVSTDEGMKIVATLQDISSSLVEEINSQRMLASAESGTLEVEHSLVDLGELIEQVVSRLMPDARARGVIVQVRAAREAVTIITDAAILRRVVLNAVKNAVEASARDDVVGIDVRTAANGVEIVVHNPAHMPEEVQHQVFNRFYSTKGANRGLGTYSMLLFTETYLGGSISFETDGAEGTTFRISLPTDIRAVG